MASEDQQLLKPPGLEVNQQLPEPKITLSHTNSLPGSQHLSPVNEPKGVFKQQSLRIKRPNKEAQQDRTSRWSFGGVAKAVGSGVTAFGSGVVQGTMAVGSGVVQGTKAVGSGVVQGTKAVGTGVVEGTKAVGTGVVEGTKVVGDTVVSGSKAVGTGVIAGTKVVASVSKDVTLAASTKVVQAGDLALSGVSAVGEATVSSAKASADAMKRAVHESLGHEDDEIHVVLPDEDLDSLSMKYGVSKRDLIRVNSLNRRSLRPGQELIIPGDTHDVLSHPNETLIVKATNEHEQAGLCKLTLDSIVWSEEGTEKFHISLKNVRVIRMDIQKSETLPDLMSPTEAGVDQRALATINESRGGETRQSATLVEIQEEEDIGSSPDDDSENSVIRLDITLYCNDGMNPDEDDETSEDEDDSKEEEEASEDQNASNYKASSHTTKSYRFERSDLLPLASYLELWHSELFEMSPRAGAILRREKDLTYAFNNPFDEQDPELMGGPAMNDKSDILEDPHLNQLFAHLPAKIQSQHWSLKYSTNANGFSLRNLYRCSCGGSDDLIMRQSSTADEESGPSLMVIQSTEGRIFGAFLSCSLGITETFVGTGKSWLFAFGGRKGQKLRVYKWSGINEHFYRGTNDTIIMGADEGHFGILIDGDLHKGRVQECATFLNWPLADLDEDFEIHSLEVWGFESFEAAPLTS